MESTVRFRMPILLLLAAAVLAGCASGGPKPARLIRQGKKAYAKQDYRETLLAFQKVMDTRPFVLERHRYVDEVEHYRDAQIKFGLAKAQAAEQDHNLVEAWIWSVQTSLVVPERQECITASENAARLRKGISESFLAKATVALGDGDKRSALAFAARSLWYGGGPGAASVLNQAVGRVSSQDLPWVWDEVSPTLVSDFVRTDSIERLKAPPEFRPYGLPIYFGDIPKYYITLGTVRVRGMPIPQPIPPEYAKLDSLWKLTRRAEKRFHPDALIKVTYKTKSKKAFTVGEAVKFVDLEGPSVAVSEPRAESQSQASQR